MESTQILEAASDDSFTSWLVQEVRGLPGQRVLFNDIMSIYNKNTDSQVILLLNTPMLRYRVSIKWLFLLLTHWNISSSELLSVSATWQHSDEMESEILAIWRKGDHKLSSSLIVNSYRFPRVFVDEFGDKFGDSLFKIWWQILGQIRYNQYNQT